LYRRSQIPESLSAASNLCLLALGNYRADGERLAQRLGVPFVDDVSSIPHGSSEQTIFYLCLDREGLSLVQRKALSGAGSKSSIIKLRADFLGGRAGYRQKKRPGRGEALPRAVGFGPRFSPYVADVTAGLGRDASLLAALGARVSMIERNPVVAALLEDGISRLRRDAQDQSPGLQPVAESLRLYCQDGLDWLCEAGKTQVPDVVYLDPMFPARTKSARVKKEMALLQSLVGDDADVADVLVMALDTARYRVVVKRPNRALPLSGPKPTFSLAGKTIRFDVYSRKKLPT